MMKILLLISTIIMTVTSRRLFIEDEERSIQRQPDATSVLENLLKSKKQQRVLKNQPKSKRQRQCERAWNTFVGKVNEGERIWCDIFGNKAETAKVIDMSVVSPSKCMMEVWRNDPAIYQTYVDKSYMCGRCQEEWKERVKERINKAELNWCEIAACDKMVEEAKWAEAKDVDEFLSTCDGDSNEIKNYQDKCKKCGECKSLWTSLKAMVKAENVTWCAICGTSKDLASAMGIGSQAKLVSDCIDDVWADSEKIWDEFYAAYDICYESQCDKAPEY